MYFYDIVGRKVLESLVKEPNKIKVGKTLEADDKNNSGIYHHYDNSSVSDKPFLYEDTPYYVINLQYDWRSSCYVWNIREEIDSKQKLLMALQSNSMQSLKLPAPVITDILKDTSITYNLSRHTAAKRKEDEDYVEYDKINKDTLHTISINNLSSIATYFSDENDKSFIEDIINKYIDSKTRISDLTIFNRIIENYVSSFNTYEKKSKAFWFCVDITEKRFKIRTSQRCRRFMTTIFASCATNAFYSDRKALLAERDYYLVNTYFKYYTDMWTCRNIIIECLDHIDDMSDADLTSLLCCVDSGIKEKIMKKVNHSESLSDIDLLTKRVYCNQAADGARSTLIELIYSIISKYSPEEFKKTAVDLLASAIVKTKTYERMYSSLPAQDDLLTQKENMDYLAERIIEKIAEKRQPSTYIELVIKQGNDTSYFFQSLKQAAESSENKKVKKAIFRMNV